MTGEVVNRKANIKAKHPPQPLLSVKSENRHRFVGMNGVNHSPFRFVIIFRSFGLLVSEPPAGPFFLFLLRKRKNRRRKRKPLCEMLTWNRTIWESLALHALSASAFICGIVNQPFFFFSSLAKCRKEGERCGKSERKRIVETVVKKSETRVGTGKMNQTLHTKKEPLSPCGTRESANADREKCTHFQTTAGPLQHRCRSTGAHYIERRKIDLRRRS